jgi:DNA-binding SARP family transcriptional activator
VGAHASIGSGKPLALLTYLACAGSRSGTRDELTNLLWSDVDLDAGRHALRQTVWYLRKRFGDDVLITRGNLIALEVPIRFDRDDFLTYLATGNRTAALESYKGDFLPHLAVPGGAEFEHWADLERQRLRLAFMRAAESVGREALESGRYRDALQLGRRIRDTDNGAISGWRLILESLASSGDVLGAATESDRLQQLIDEDEIDADPSLLALLRAARLGEHGDPDENPKRASSGLVTDLIGRESEFEALTSAWSTARQGTGSHWHLQGDAGMGKTRLLRDTAVRLSTNRGRVAQLRANPGERSVPYALIAELCEALANMSGALGLGEESASILVGLDPRLSSHFKAPPDSSTGDEALRRRALAVVELIEAVAEDGPLAILIDDLHWLDQASSQALALVVERIARLPVLVITTSRAPAKTLGAQTIALLPLSALQITQFVEHVARLPDSAWAESFPDALLRSTGGSPLLVIETLQLAIDQAVLTPVDETWTCQDPARLAELLREGSALDRRIASLTANEKDALAALAVAGRPLTPNQAASVLERLSVADRDSVMLSLVARGFISDEAGPITVRHDEITAGVLASLDARRLAAVHLALAETLLATSPDALSVRLVASHLMAADATDRLTSVVRMHVRAARRDGDRRSTERLVRELCGDQLDLRRLHQCLRAVPWRDRTRSVWIKRLVTAAVASVVFATIVLAVRPRVEPIAWLVGKTSSGPVSAALLANDWNAVEAIPIRTEAASILPSRIARTGGGPGIPVGDGSWLHSAISADSGGWDVYRSFPDGATIRLTDFPADDDIRDVSPDGRTAIIASGRWNADQRLQLGLIDLETKRLTRFWSDDSRNSEARWSPDGARIAFRRAFRERKLPEICISSVGADSRHCIDAPGFTDLYLHAWVDAQRLIVERATDSSSALAYLDIASGRFTDIPLTGVDWRVSRNGRFVLSQRKIDGSQRFTWEVADLRSGAEPARLVLDVPEGIALDAVLVDTAALHPASHYLDRLKIQPPAGPIALDFGHQFLVKGFTRDGLLAEIHDLRWSISDSSVATITSTGRLLPSRPGTIVVRASAGGWRTDSVVVRIETARAYDLLLETWQSLDTGHWTPFGSPAPRVGIAGGRPALLPSGDSSFTSGVHSTRAFAVDQGIGARFLARAEQTLGHWQFINVDFATYDSLSLARWDHVTGAISGGTRAFCEFATASGETYPASKRMLLSAGSQIRRVPADRAVLRGAWVSVAIQVFPDGRCGIALDGKPMLLTERVFDPSAKVTLTISSQSVRTDAAVGPLQLWRGVDPGIAWRSIARVTSP